MNVSPFSPPRLDAATRGEAAMRNHAVSQRAARVLASGKLRFCEIVALFCLFASLCGEAAARESVSIPPFLPRPTPILPLSQSQVSAPPIDEKTARRHAAKLFNYGQVRARAWVLIDAESGRVLAGRNARQKMFPASTTKTLTALVALSEGDLDGVVRVGTNPPQTGEQSIYLLQGEQFSLRDLLRAAMIKSANDACVAIAEGVAGSVPAFAQRMNAKAKEAGATGSNFVNPHGLHDPNHFTTARDLALIARAAMNYPFFNEIAKTRETEIHGNWKMGGPRLLMNKNRLLFRWSECDGVKTGYTKQAGRCLIASATQKVADTSGKSRDFRLISVVLHSPDIWSDSWYALQKLGFERFRPGVLARENEIAGEIDVAGAAAKAQTKFAKTIEIPLRLASTRGGEAAPITKRIDPLPNLQAPLSRGRVLGTATFFQSGAALVKVPVISAADVPQSTFAAVLPTNSNLFSPDVLMFVAIALVALMSAAFFIAAWRQHQISKNERTRNSQRK